MNAPPPRSFFQPFDILLKDRGAPVNWLIRLKRGSDVSHSEVVVRRPRHPYELVVATSNLGTGVDYYPLTTGGLVYVLRLRQDARARLDHTAALAWFDQVARGQGYDYLGMASFFLAKMQGWQNGRQFCSEVNARMFKKGGLALLHARKDCDTYAPDSFKDSPLVDYVWEREPRRKQTGRGVRAEATG